MKKTVIDIHNVSKVYNPDTIPVHAVNNVHLHFEQGEFTALVGPSGSGKTTLLNIIGGLDAPTQGSVIINGTDITHLSANALIRFRLHHIGFVFQSYHLIARLTAWENVELPLLLAGVPARERRAAVEPILEKLGIARRSHHLPNQLSGGERQRVAIGRSIIMKPAIILADEPTGNLDSKSGGEVTEILENLNRDCPSRCRG